MELVVTANKLFFLVITFPVSDMSEGFPPRLIHFMLEACMEQR